MSDKVISKTKYSRKEHKRFYMFHLKHRTSSLFLLGGLVILLLCLTCYQVFKLKEGYVFYIIMFAITVAIIPYLIISKVNNVVKQETPERVRSTDTIEVTKHKITRSNDIINGKATIGWKQLDCVCEDDEFFYIYTTDQQGLFVKKADIVEGDVESLRKIALDNVPTDKQGKPMYLRYGQVKKDYQAIVKAKKAKEKEEKALAKAKEKAKKQAKKETK